MNVHEQDVQDKPSEQVEKKDTDKQDDLQGNKGADHGQNSNGNEILITSARSSVVSSRGQTSLGQVRDDNKMFQPFDFFVKTGTNVIMYPKGCPTALRLENRHHGDPRDPKVTFWNTSQGRSGVLLLSPAHGLGSQFRVEPALHPDSTQQEIGILRGCFYLSVIDAWRLFYQWPVPTSSDAPLIPLYTRTETDVPKDGTKGKTSN